MSGPAGPIIPPMLEINPHGGPISNHRLLALTLRLQDKAIAGTTITLKRQMLPTSGPQAVVSMSPNVTMTVTSHPGGPPVIEAIPVPIGTDHVPHTIPVENNTGAPAILMVTAQTQTTPPIVTETFQVPA